MEKCSNNPTSLEPDGTTWADRQDEEDKQNAIRNKKSARNKVFLQVGVALLIALITSLLGPVVFYEYKTFREGTIQQPSRNMTEPQEEAPTQPNTKP